MKLHFRKIGQGSPLIILHGLFGSSDNWQTIGKKFTEHNFCVYLVDQRNHGHSPHANEFSYKVMSEDVAELLKDENIIEPAVIGHSMGGKTAMQLAMQYSEKISKIIVVDMAPKQYPVHHREILDALLSIDLTVIKTRSEVEKKLSPKINDNGTLQFLLKNLYWKENNELAWRFNLIGINEKIEEMSEMVVLTKRFDKPAFFIRGEKSNYILPADEPLIKKYFPKAVIKSAPAAGHWVHADNPQWLLENCIEFLRN